MAFDLKSFMSTVLATGNTDLPGRAIVTVSHIFMWGPSILVWLSHPKLWLKPYFFLLYAMLLGWSIPWWPKDVAGVVTKPADPEVAGHLAGGDPYAFGRLFYWYNHVTPVGEWAMAIYIVMAIGNFFVFVDKGRYAYKGVLVLTLAASLYLAGKLAQRFVTDDGFNAQAFLDECLKTATMEADSVTGADKTVSGTHFFYDVLMMVVISVVYVVLEAPGRFYTLLCPGAFSLVCAATDSMLVRGRNAAAGAAYLCCAALSLYFWLPHQMEYGDKVWSVQAYKDTRGPAGEVNPSIRFCKLNTFAPAIILILTMMRLASELDSVDFWVLQFLMGQLTMGTFMHIAFTTSVMMATAKLAGPKRKLKAE